MTPLFLMRTGCRWRTTLVMTARARFRSLSIHPWRKIDCQICVEYSHWSALFPRRGRMAGLSSLSSAMTSTRALQEGLGVFPLALLLLELLGLVDQELPVLRERDAVALERARRGAFEVDAGGVEARAVAGTLEL